MTRTNYFETNLDLLSKYDPALAARLRDYAPVGRAQVFETPGGQLSLRLNHNNHEHLLHSSRDPDTEASRWVESLNLSAMYNVMILGGGLFYHAYRLVEKFHHRLANLVIIEKDIDALHQAFYHINLSAFLQSQSTHILVDPSPRELRAFMNARLTPFVLNGIKVIEHPASVEVYPEFYHPAKVIVEESLQNGEIMLRTKEQLGGMIQENIIRNLPNLFANPSATALHGLLKDIPAIVVGAGPSLDWNIDRLADVKDAGVIIASDTVFKKLRERNIEPHLVVTTDPTPNNKKHFEGLRQLEESALVFSPSVDPSIVEQLEGTKVSLPLPTSKILHAMRDVIGEQNYFAPGINVAQTCFNLADFMGCDPILLTGLDLSFPIDGGHTHCSGTAYRRSIRLGNTPGKMMVELLGDPPEWEEFTPVVIRGNRDGSVATNKFWLAYLRSFEEAVANTKARVINCTEGGAVIAGADVDTLANAIEAHCRNDAMARSTLQMSVGFFFGHNPDAALSTLNEATEILALAIEKASEGLSRVNALKTVFESENASPEIMKELIDDIAAMHEELIQNHKVYAVLDEAADSILSPFLRMENRPLTDEINAENVEKHIKRYGDYFGGMKTLCESYAGVVNETLEKFDEPTLGAF